MQEVDDGRLIARIAAELRRPVPASAGFDERVMAAVREAPPSLPARAWSWLREPRLTLSPLGGLALAAGVAAVAIVGGLALGGTQRVRAGAGVVEAPTAEIAGAAQSLVTFVLVAPRAQSVALAGDFDGWDRARLPMRRETSGIWTVDVPLAPGRYRYAFVVNGSRFVADPSAPRAVGDDFGQPTSVLTVGGGAL